MTVPGLVIVTHNSVDDTLAAISSARAAGFSEIVVADAGSSDGTVEALGRAASSVRVLGLPNLGFGGCANRGVALTTSDLVVVANADVTFGDDTASAFARAFDDVATGIVGPLVEHPDGTRQLSARREPGAIVAVLHAILGLWWPGNPWTRRYRGADLATGHPQSVDWVSGCCLAFRRRVFDDVGGFDPAFFLFMEDVDLCHRVRAAGHRVVFDPAVRVVHRVGGALDRDRRAARRAHADSLVRWARKRHGILAAAVVWAGAQAWRLSATVFDRTRGRRRPSTGEDTEHMHG